MSGLVSYSDSENESADEMQNEKLETNTKKIDVQSNIVNTKKKRKIIDLKTNLSQNCNKIAPLPVPISIQKMFSSQNIDIMSSSIKLVTNLSTTSRLNKKLPGKVRTFEHFEGNWPTYVFTPLTINSNTISLYNYLVHNFKDLSLTFFQLDECHISLSRTVPIRHYWMEPLYSKLKDCIPLHSFTYSFLNIKVYVNDEKTRTFIGVEINSGYSKLKEITDSVDKVFKEFGLDIYYKEPSFHVSFAWCLGDKKTEIEKYIDSFSQLKDQFSILASKVCMKCGNKLFQICLQ
ncbi:U6 snRNA phosphodiesterase 1 [Hydra vulgaris]|uniref:U6 snRNA phosphodiesterase 1 n=1 Tax=Hydra vulgaris TaxID=6087 RepID=A0ABM4CHW1_HYDVU